jgi:hypothetical protein
MAQPGPAMPPAISATTNTITRLLLHPSRRKTTFMALKRPTATTATAIVLPS